MTDPSEIDAMRHDPEDWSDPPPDPPRSTWEGVFWAGMVVVTVPLVGAVLYLMVWLVLG